MPTRILLADDHLIVRQGLRAILEGEGFEVMAEVGDGQEATKLARQRCPDVAVLDFSMPSLNGLDAAREILKVCPRARAILLTMHTEDHYVLEALRHLNEALEEEIKRIAHALHDEAGQLLASVHIVLADIARELPTSSSQRLEEVRSLLNKIEEQLRHLSHELRPTILDDLGLQPALEFLADGVSKRTGLRISVAGTPGSRLPPATETALYRIVQEALTNVTRHAQAAHVAIAFSRNGHALCCSIQDDGAGFDVATRSVGAGFVNMNDRLGAVGGSLRVESTPGRGTRITGAIPLDRADAPPE